MDTAHRIKTNMKHEASLWSCRKKRSNAVLVLHCVVDNARATCTSTLTDTAHHMKINRHHNDGLKSLLYRSSSSSTAMA